MSQSWQSIEMFSPRGFVTNIPFPGLCGCPIRNKQKCFWLPCLLSPSAFLSAAVLFLHRCVSRLRRIGTVWLAVWRHGRRRGGSHCDLSHRLLGKCVWGQRVWRSKCVWGRVCILVPDLFVPCLCFSHVPLCGQVRVTEYKHIHSLPTYPPTYLNILQKKQQM